MSGLEAFSSCSSLVREYPETRKRALPKAIMHIGTYHKAKEASISGGTTPFRSSLITELSGKDINDKIIEAKNIPNPLTALSAKLLAENKIPYSLLPVLS